MKKQTPQEEIAQALLRLGYGSGVGSAVKCEQVSYHRCLVTVDGKEVGVYDFDRNTFVE